MRFSPGCAATTLLSLWTCPSSAAPSHVDCPEVYSTSGLVIGHRAPNRSDTFEFLGIKYGRAPVGDLRFAAPQRYIAPAGTVYEALNWNADCPNNVSPVTKFPNFTGNGFEIYNKFSAHLGNDQSEDCLALNVWTKAPGHHDEIKRPVLVYLHGGRFTFPGPHSPFLKGQYLAGHEDVVVVTINYRLGMFGFSGAPGVEPNAALRDQRLAVEWVRDNISGFGGDPKRIIIFGQSVGGSSVDYYAVAYKDDPIATGLVSISGTAFSYTPNTPEYSHSLYLNVSGTLGCGDHATATATSLACLRSKPFKDILGAALHVPALPTQAVPQAAFHPTIDNVSVFSLADYLSIFKRGEFAKIPYVAGNGDYEAGFYRVSAFGANITLTPAQWDLYNQRAFTCPAKYSTDFRAEHGVPTWRYRYMGDWDNLRLYPAYDGYPDSGSYHGSDLDMIFGTAYDVTGQANTVPEELTSRYMMGAYAAFARDPKRGLDLYGWPEARRNTASLMRFGYNNSPGPHLAHPSIYDRVCPPVDQNDPLPGRGGF